MEPRQIYTRAALNGAVAGVIAMAAAITAFSLLGHNPIGLAILLGIAFGVVTFAVVAVGIYAVLRSRHPRVRPPGRQA
ncbi:hypothetical protein [Brachybacterium endophyticum]|uniref:hypothetical protein n=1 Tax=Brachybacterium endophyticum TaxID=2182385 RepID=UPI0014034BF9|nr:hypothetical protein [Brachybacterium endophyticum]